MSAITTSMNGEALVVEFLDHKLLDSERIEHVGRELMAAVARAPHKKLLVSFKGVSFMSSAMITKLVSLNKECKAHGVDLTLCDVAPNVMEVFRIARLHKLVHIDGGPQPPGSDVADPPLPPTV